MSDLAELLGQREIAERLFTDLVHRGMRVARLAGPPGTGKTETARQVIRHWSDGGDRVVVAQGDNRHAERALYPVLSGLTSLGRDWAETANKGTRVALETAGKVVPAGGAAPAFWDLLTTSFRQPFDRALRPFSNQEKEVVRDLRRIARNHRVLIVAENAHWWDADSLRLAETLVSGDLEQAVPQLRHVSLLLVDTADEQAVVAPGAFDALAAAATASTQRTTRCSRLQFPAVLAALGLKQPLPDTVLDELFAVASGHLKVAEQIAAYARTGDVAALLDDHGAAYLTKLVAARFATLGTARPGVGELVASAAVLGLSFSERDLKCIVERQSVDDLVTHAEALGFLARDEVQIGFTHDVIRAAVLGGRDPEELRELYAKLSGCLAILRPGDYAARAYAHEQAGDDDRAREMLALAGVSALRGGTPRSRIPGWTASRDVEYLDVIADAYALVDAGDYLRAIGRLRTTVADETELMAAERHYLLALCSMELQTVQCAEDAITTLNTWMSAVGDAFELRLRYLRLLQQAQVLANRFDAARATEAAIERELAPRKRFDPSARIAEQIQHRRAAALDSPEIAVGRIEGAVAFFAAGAGDAVRDQLELYRALTNLAAVQLRLGRDSDAHASAQEAERIAVAAPDLVTRLDVLASNAVLACYRSGAIDAQAAVARQQLVINSPEGAADKIIHRCNLVAYLLLAGRDGEAGAELLALQNELSGHEFDESYLVFYSATLAVGHALLIGDRDEARTRHHALDDFVNALAWPAAPYVRRRHQLLEPMLATLDVTGERDALDRALLTARPHEIGPAWPYYARLLPCAELSFWSDS